MRVKSCMLPGLALSSGKCIDKTRERQLEKTDPVQDGGVAFIVGRLISLHIGDIFKGMNILDRLGAGEVLLSDGAMGTELQKHGVSAGICPEEWNFSHPDVVCSIHSRYFAAGSDFVETNTFGGNRVRLAPYGLGTRVKELCRRASELARSSAPPAGLVAGSMGPTGDLLEPLGVLTATTCREIFVEQAEGLAAGGADFLVVETMMAIEEAEIAVAAAKEATGFPVFCTMTFAPTANGIFTMWGVDIPTAIERLTAAGADVLGANCGSGFDEIAMIIREMRPLTSLPLMAQPNAGVPDIINGVPVYRETPESIAPRAVALLKLGVNVLGGCCGTGPEHIRMLRQVMNER
jgi:5-methyltetrahydrofolate--homocysteine methyltransferase